MRPLRLICVILSVVVIGGCKNGVKIAGSTCAAAADCQVYASCGKNPDACSCVGGACWYDSTVPSSTPEGCRGCHGTLVNAAPPKDTQGGTSTSLIGVGAHQTHLSGGVSSRPVPCASCHLVPVNVDDPGHNDTPLPAEVTWGNIAAPTTFPDGDGGTVTVTSTWNHDTQSCTGYCHGNLPWGPSGGSNLNPTWTVVDGTQAACGTCHGVPPPAPHPQVDSCELCHGLVVGPNQQIINSSLHVNGTLEMTGSSCTSCHGDSARTDGTEAAPPKSLNGDTATTSLGVGAHQSHLHDGLVRLALPCSECHLVPSNVGSPGHIDTPLPAEVIFGTLATTGNVTPVWNRSTATCSSSYCHGNFAYGNAATNNPKWTQVDGSQSQCGSCHGTPPPASTGHPQGLADVTTCYKCHPQTVSPSGTINISSGTHINGQPDVIALACSSCHGDASRLVAADNRQAAPPVDTTGNSADTVRGVGAHSNHLDQSSWHRTVQCADCHATVPTTMTHSNGTVDVVFSGVGAQRDGGSTPTPSYSKTTLTCTNVYCHGATLPGPIAGGSINRSPIWTQSNGVFNNCGNSCHTNPPAAPHPQGAGQCSTCHTHVDPGGTSFIDGGAALHINGKLEVANMACNACHGNSAGNPALDSVRAPPQSTLGVLVTTDLGVGAHQRHLTASTVAGPFPCVSCHLVPVNVGDPGHTDTPLPAEVIFSGTAVAGGASPVWARGPATCAGAYCHGATISGGTNLTPSWTAVTGAPLGCTACHGAPPPLPHVQQTDCFSCHDLTATDAGTILVAGGHHIDGVLDISGAACTTCHGTSGVNNAPPNGVSGQTLTTQPAVGAHQKHMVGGAWHAPVNCQGCHPVPTSPGDAGVHQNGITNLTFDGGATYSSSAHTCSNSYCHGAGLQPAKTGGTIIRTPLWTQVDGTQSACGASCHTNPPGGTHVQVPNSMCPVCHAAVVDGNLNIINASLHINHVKDSTTPTCSGCHGGSTNAAPPVDTTGQISTAAVTVGAHQSHLNDNAIRKAIACTECHLVPVNVGDTGHIDPSPAEVIFGTLAKTGGLAPTWNRTAGTCTSVYCHGGSLDGGAVITVPQWTKVDGTQAACGAACHGTPPPAPHEQGNNSCETCHSGTVGRDTSGIMYIKTDGGLHINGTIEATGSHPQPQWDTPDSGNFHGDAFNDGTYTACVSCHGPTLTGGSGPACETACHTGTAFNPSPHVGWKTNCVFCHGGTSSTTGAPPVNLMHQTATTSLTVGAHTSHLAASHALASPVQCAVCHVVPTDALSPNHIYLNLSAGTIDPRPAEVIFGGLGKIGDGGVAAYTAGSCSTYCHGFYSGGNTANQPLWTDVNSATARACNKCHNSPPATGGGNGHNKSEHKVSCSVCHNSVTTDGVSISNPALHINGSHEVVFDGVNAVQGSTPYANKQCYVNCHLNGGKNHNPETW